MATSCVFCEIINSKQYLFDNDLAIALKDIHPASKGHTLVIPKRHCLTYFDLTKEEVKAMYELSNKVKKYLDDLYHPDGYNIVFNCLEAGGQSVMHCHMHVIPRYKGKALLTRSVVNNIK